MQFLKPKLYTTWLYVTGRSSQSCILQDMREKQLLSAQQTDDLHQKRLANLLRFSFERVPYYREQLQILGLGLSNIESSPLDVLNALPLLDKGTLRKRFDDLKADDLVTRQWHINTSGGSTGEPAQFVQDRKYHHASIAAANLFDEWTGHQSGKPKVVLWGSERDLLVGKDSLRTQIGRWIRNEWPLNAFRMSETDMRHFVNTINLVKPEQVLAYVDSAFELARFIEREKLTIHAPKAILVSAGTLYPHMREMIERVFAAPVFNRYGSREVGGIACECAYHKGLHVNPYTHHVEILREDGNRCVPGEMGEVVVTLLINEAMPLLRYRIGDMAVLAQQPCDCGRHWPLLSGVFGRTNSIIRTQAGSFDSAALSSLLYFKDLEKTQPFCSFSRYQLVQKSKSDFLFRVVVNEPELWRVEKGIVLDKLSRTVGNEVKIIIKEENKIEPSVSGKYVYIYSEIE